MKEGVFIKFLEFLFKKTIKRNNELKLQVDENIEKAAKIDKHFGDIIECRRHILKIKTENAIYLSCYLPFSIMIFSLCNGINSSLPIIESIIMLLIEILIFLPTIKVYAFYCNIKNEQAELWEELILLWEFLRNVEKERNEVF